MDRLDKNKNRADWAMKCYDELPKEIRDLHKHFDGRQLYKLLKDLEK